MRGSYNGALLTVGTGVDANASPIAAVGFSTGAGLAEIRGSHTFGGETFDDNDFVFFPTLRGDVNFDRAVNFTDLVRLAQSYGSATSRGYADGNVNNPAAAGATDFDDLVALSQNYGKSFSIASLVAARAKTARTRRASIAKDVLQ